MCRAGGIFGWRRKFRSGTEFAQELITMRMPRRWRRAGGERARDLEMYFTRALEQELVRELFWMERFFMGGLDRRRRAGTSALIIAGRGAIAGSWDVLRRWLRGRRLRGARGRQWLAIRNAALRYWHWRVGMRWRFEARWWGALPLRAMRWLARFCPRRLNIWRRGWATLWICWSRR